MAGAFFMYNPTLSQNNESCSLDLITDDYGILHQGTAELIAECLQKACIVGQVQSWSCEPFCSPYYAKAHTPTWREVFKRAWRVTVLFSSKAHSTRSLQDTSLFYFSPLNIETHDETCTEEVMMQNLNWEVRKVVFITDWLYMKTPDIISKLQNFVGQHAGLTTEILTITPEITQVRLDYGVRDVAQEYEQLKALQTELTGLATSTSIGKSRLADMKVNEKKKSDQLRTENAELLKKLGLKP